MNLWHLGYLEILALLVGVVLFAFWIWALVQATSLDEKTRGKWVVFIALTYVFGALIYVLAEKVVLTRQRCSEEESVGDSTRS